MTKDLLHRALPERGRSVLELGSGTGLGYSMLPDKWRKGYIGIDLSPRMIDSAKARFPEADFRCCDIAELATLGGSFDFVFAINGVCSYLTEPEKFLIESTKLVSPGGSALLSFLNRYSLRRMIRFNFGSQEPLGIRKGVFGDSLEQQFLVSLMRVREIVRASSMNLRFSTSYSLFGGLWENRFSSAIDQSALVRRLPFGHGIYVCYENKENIL